MTINSILSKPIRPILNYVFVNTISVFFEKIQKEHDEAGAPDMDGALSMLSTHPATKERIANLNALIENGADSGPYRIIDLDFEAFQEKLKALLNE